jgi:hypothetical protein
MSEPRVSDAPPIVVKTLAEILEHKELLQAPAEVIPYLAWKGRVTLLAGREKSGKSSLAAAGCATLTSGGYFLGHFTNVARILWLSADAESLYDQVARFRRFGAEPKNTYIVTDWDRTPSGLFRVAQGAAVVVIDTLASFAELLAPDAGSSADWSQIMLSIKRCANDTGAAFLLDHHANKASGTYRDSTAIGAGVDCILEMTESPDAPNVRRLKARARWTMPDFSIRLEGDRFELDDNALSLDAQILAAIVAAPGISGNQLRQQIKGHRDVDVVATVKRLASDGAIANHGAARKAAWYPVTPAPASVVPVVPSVPEQPQSGSCSRALRSREPGTTTPEQLGCSESGTTEPALAEAET